MNKSPQTAVANPVFPIMIAIAVCHLFNDTLQAVIPAMLPILEKEYQFSYKQLGYIVFALNIVASLLQPVVGYLSDRKPKPFALPIGMTFSLIGMAGLALAPSYWLIIVSVMLLGLGSAIFHPEGSRVSFLAAGDKRGLSQSIYQVGGNSGQALAPLISAFVLVPLGQIGAAVFVLVAAAGIALLTRISFWYKNQLNEERLGNRKKVLLTTMESLSKRQVTIALILLMIIIFARSFYVTNITSFYIFYLIEYYGMTIQHGQLYIFLFLALGAVGTFFGGPMADRIGRKKVIVLSLVVPLPLSLLLPYAPVWGIILLLVTIGFFIMLSFSVTVIYAQELVPSKIGTMAGLTVGLAFGMGAIGAVAIGTLIDSIGIYQTMIITSFLPFIGLVGLALPRDQKITSAS
ncbi:MULTISPECIES: MFS transporter [unclassified Sporosarcina]|uniref:MFS transporter n=1 Tax=unclassified Sporosarcina TaxID=2647733 RepID=UPI000C16E85A|nr:MULTISPECIES: MFS transporter [unclassified Sporosarcina]PID00855.1 MFS transporter [Sporosarcina sp. P29]PID07086.1 MFS transporter [Sporosarcina sp. P30]PID10282.1 MFS transporter [Sporosarcina sp. P31]PID12180.1 MFS transporter [Sporosarcina sp. P32b]